MNALSCHNPRKLDSQNDIWYFHLLFQPPLMAYSTCRKSVCYWSVELFPLAYHAFNWEKGFRNSLLDRNEIFLTEHPFRGHSYVSFVFRALLPLLVTSFDLLWKCHQWFVNSFRRRSTRVVSWNRSHAGSARCGWWMRSRTSECEVDQVKQNVFILSYL